MNSAHPKPATSDRKLGFGEVSAMANNHEALGSARLNEEDWKTAEDGKKIGALLGASTEKDQGNRRMQKR